jgi:hypothetical protein
MKTERKTFLGAMNLDDSNDILPGGHHKEAKNGVFRGTGTSMKFQSIQGNQKVDTTFPNNACYLDGIASLPSCSLAGTATKYITTNGGGVGDVSGCNCSGGQVTAAGAYSYTDCYGHVVTGTITGTYPVPDPLVPSMPTYHTVCYDTTQPKTNITGPQTNIFCMCTLAFSGQIFGWSNGPLNNNYMCIGGYNGLSDIFYQMNVNDILGPPLYAYIDANKTPNANASYIIMYMFGFTYGYAYNSTTGQVGALVYTCLN